MSKKDIQKNLSDLVSLTVEEHLLFFGQMKSLTKKQVLDQIP